MSDNFWRRVWEVGAWHNFIGLAALIIGHDWVWTRDGLAVPVPGVLYDTWIGLVGILGLAYWMVSRNLYGNPDLVKISILAKILSATVQLTYWIYLPELFPTIFIITIFTDYGFAIAYWRFLRHAQRQMPRPA